jgi:hypothetical protein
MRGIDAVFSAARLLARTTGLSISAAVTALSLKAEVVVGFFLRQFFATDEASIADTQTLDVTKPLTESPSLVDADVITLLKRVSDSGALTDDDVLTIIKGLTETPAVTEAHVIAFTKPLTDSGSVTDTPALQPTKGLTEAPSATDNDTLDIIKIAGDDTNHDYCDLSYFAEDYIAGDRTDRAYVAETNVVSITKFLTDQTFVTDDLDGEATAEDDQEIAFVKTRTDIGVASDSFDRTVVYLRDFAENGSASESAVKLTTKARSDSAAFTDSGNLRSQGYCDFTYFAEDYVGASRTF